MRTSSHPGGRFPAETPHTESRNTDFQSALCGLGLGLALLAMLTPNRAMAADNGPVRFTVDPMPEPVPALRYTLLDEKIDQTPGNAALAYQRVTRMLASDKTWSEQKDQCRDWLELPLDQFPPEDLRKLLAGQENNLDQLVKATRFEQCDWEIPVREEGFSALLPHLSEMRDVARLLSLQIRVLVHDGHYDEAMARLRAGMTLARHVAQGELLIEGLVGVAVANTMLDRVQEMISQPGAPNLYWALTDLPPGYLNAWQSTRWERSCVYVEFPVLRDPTGQPVTPGDLRRAIHDLQNIGGPQLGWLPENEEQSVMVAGLALVAYPKAREQLIAGGRSPEEVDRMPVSQALAVYLGEAYAIQRDNLFKWFALPFPQARKGMQQAEEDLRTAAINDPIGCLLPRLLLPALTRVQERFVELDRRIAALRCVEALRAFGAASNRRLPTSLSDAGLLPIPQDPVTGAAFEYELNNGVARIEGVKISDGNRPGALSYEITLRP
ncbi:MAG: hypothetical protein H7A46_12535 [Verrucomicrobiales bacterium]|nr:hypothetical protein [Verrucomicrobiales bacterium]